MDGNHSKSAKAEGSLTATPTGGAGTKVGLSDPVVLSGNAIAQRIKATLGITGLSLPRVHIDGVVWHPRCRLIASWGCSRSQGLGCSPIKAVRELGSERRETVRSLSGVGVGYLRGAVLSTRGPGWTDRWCTCCSAIEEAATLVGMCKNPSHNPCAYHERSPRTAQCGTDQMRKAGYITEMSLVALP